MPRSVKDLPFDDRPKRLGFISMGVQVQKRDTAGKPTGQPYPKATKCFVCSDPGFREQYNLKYDWKGKNETTDDEAAAMSVYPTDVQITGPSTLSVGFHSPNPDDWIDLRHSAWSKSRGELCSGDGVKCRRKIDANTGDSAIASKDATKTSWVELDCPGYECEYQLDKAKTCSLQMMLDFVLAEIEGVGLWTMATRSPIAIKNIMRSVNLLESVAPERIAYPQRHLLSVVPVKVNPDGLREKTVHVLDMRSNIRIADLSSLDESTELVEIEAPDSSEPDETIVIDPPVDKPKANGKTMCAVHTSNEAHKVTWSPTGLMCGESITDGTGTDYCDGFGAKIVRPEMQTELTTQ